MALNQQSNQKKRKLDNNDTQFDNEKEKHVKVTRMEAPRLCPYLDTINRQFLDFDFEKLCSVSLSRINVYACLVCGKYFQGRGTNTHAYTHSVAESHHVFLNLHTLKFYCLPDNYEIVDSSLDDIKYVLNPTFDKAQIALLDKSDKLSRAIDGSMYSPGIVGMNNIKANDYCNVILQALSHVTPLRDFFLRETNYAYVKRPPGDSSYLLVQRFGELMRKLWNPRNFKAHVSPHEMLQAVVLWSKKRFQFTEQGVIVKD
ncbi:U4/U6U5 tri-snRNP-associated protein 2 [Vespula squamosa]|uniref:ubiquitinyl hydrolase 1 n=1 Tax=Vespula squamosa TaxID=30214 RepID=A0ABD2ACA1_VESSQ